MKLVFSEHKSDYGHYIFPYAIWAFPEAGETPANFFQLGFLPSSRNLDRFYLCRQVRVPLPGFSLSSENRRVLRKGEGLKINLLSRAEFELSLQRRKFCQDYAEARFGAGTMTDARLDSLFNSPITSHLLLFTEAATGAEVGIATLYLEPDRVVYYYNAFYDLNRFQRNLGMFMMTCAVKLFMEKGFAFAHLGSCYSENALYKTQFAGAEFFNGVRWSARLEELKYLLRRDGQEVSQHLLEGEEYRNLFYDGDLPSVPAASQFQVRLKA